MSFKKRTCDKCGETGFYWVKTGQQWRLAKNGVVHSCLPKKNENSSRSERSDRNAVLSSEIPVFNDDSESIREAYFEYENLDHSENNNIKINC